MYVIAALFCNLRTNLLLTKTDTGIKFTRKFIVLSFHMQLLFFLKERKNFSLINSINVTKTDYLSDRNDFANISKWFIVC